MGRTVRIDGEAWNVAGVMPPGFAFPNGTQLWVPLALTPEARQVRNSRRLFVLARLAEGVSTSEASAEAAAFGRRLATEHAATNAEWMVRTMNAEQYFGRGPRPFMIAMLGAAAFIALLMAAVGTYGVMAYTVAQRTHAIGVRVALGARTTDVTGLVLRQASLLVGVGLVIGVGGALAMGVGLRAVLFETNPADPLAIALTALTLALIAALATWLPARRAARIDPVVALRSE